MSANSSGASASKSMCGRPATDRACCDSAAPPNARKQSTGGALEAGENVGEGVDGAVKFLGLYDQGRGNPQRAAVRLFAQHAAIPKRQADLPSACRVHIDSGPQTAAAYVGEAVPDKARQATVQPVTEFFGSLLEFPAGQ